MKKALFRGLFGNAGLTRLELATSGLTGGGEVLILLQLNFTPQLA